MLPLSGINIIEWGGDTATALCGLLLADLGARVILVEPPGGSEARRFTAPLVDGESALFLTLNRGKKSIAIDAESAEGQGVLKVLHQQADVLLEGVGPERLRAAGIGYEALQKTNPRLIVYSINTYGSEGWYSREQGDELEAQAVTGLQFLGHYTKPPVRVGADVATTMTALCACQGVLAALSERLSSGLGQRGETSLLDGWVQAIGFLATHWSADVDEWMHYAHTGPWSVEDVGFQTKDLSISFRLGAPITKFQKDRWITFCRAMGLDRLIDDPWWYDNAALTIDFPMLTRETYEEALKKRSSAEVIDFVHKIGGVAAPILDHSKIWSHPQLAALGLVSKSPLPNGGALAHLRPPWHFSHTPLGADEGPPIVGEHTEEILNASGYGDQDITRLIRLGAVQCARKKPKGG